MLDYSFLQNILEVSRPTSAIQLNRQAPKLTTFIESQHLLIDGRE